MSTILCATDFSPCSRTATRLAAALARRHGEGLLLLYALEPVSLDAVSGSWEKWLVGSRR